MLASPLTNSSQSGEHMARRKQHKKKPNTDTEAEINNPTTNDTATNAQAQIIPHTTRSFLTLFETLQRATPRDHNGFPTYLIDHSVIPPHYDTLSHEDRTRYLEAAQIPLSMLEGYLSFDQNTQTPHPTPTPVWSQLPHEPDSYFHAFRIHLLSAHRNVAEAQTSNTPGFSSYTIREAYVLFHWRERARAYDILKPVAAARLRDQRLLLMEDMHFQLGHQLVQTLTQEIAHRTKTDPDQRPFAGLKSKELIDSLIAATEVQRVALRMPAKGPRNHMQEPTPNTSPERAIKEAASHYDGVQDSDGALDSKEQLRKKIDRAIAEDPSKAASLQDMALDILLRTRENTKSDSSNEGSTD